MASIERLTTQDIGGTVSGASLALTLPGEPHPGFLQVVTFFTNRTVISVPGFQIGKVQAMGSASGQRVGIYYRVMGAQDADYVAGTADNLTITSTSATLLQAHWFEYAFCDGTNPLDVTAGQSGGTTGRTSYGSGTTTVTSQGIELAVAAWGFSGGTTAPYSATSSFSVIRSNTNLVTAERVTTASGTQTSTLSWATTQAAGGCIATFKAGLGRKVRVSGAWTPKPSLVKKPSISGWS